MAKLDDYIEQLEVRLLESTAGQQLLARYRGLSDYEQLLAKSAIMVVSLLLIASLLVLPPLGYVSRARAEYVDARNDFAWINVHAGAAHNAAVAHATGANSESLLKTVTVSAERHGIKLRRFSPSGEGTAQVRIDDINFDRLTGWLQELLQSGTVVLDKITISHGSKPHVVSASIELRG